MADVSLKFKSDADQAIKDFNDLGSSSEAVRKKIEKFSESFKSEQIDRFREKNKLAGIAMTATSGKFAGMQAEAKGLQRDIQNLIKKGLSPEDAALKKLITDYNKLDKEIAETSAATKKQGNIFSSGVKKLAAYAAAYVSFRAAASTIKSLTTGLAEQGDQVAKTSRQLGLTAEQLQELQFAADRSGVSSEAFTKSMQKMNKSVGEARAGTGTLVTFLNKSNPELLKQVQAANSSEEAFNLLANEVNNLQSPLDKAALANAAFGRSGVSMITMMEGGTEAIQALRDEAQKYGNIITNEAAAASEKFIDAQTNLTSVLKGLIVNIGSPLLVPITNAMNSFVEWATTGDNLKDTLTTMGYVLAGVTSGIVAFLAVSKGAVAIQALTTAFKGLTAAIAANPIGLIATVITAVLVPAIIWLIKNWDIVKYKVVDFGLAAREKMLSLGIAIREKVIGSLTALLDQLAKIPIIGKMFAKISDAEKKVTAQMQNGLETVKLLRAANKKNFEASQAEATKRIETAKNESGIIQSENDKIIQSNLSRADAFKKVLDGMKESERVQQEELIIQAQEFFEKRAEAEGNDYASRIEYLQEYLDKVKNMENISAENRKALEEGITRAIQKQQKNRIQNAITFGQQMLSSTSELLTSLQTIFQNAGKSAYGLAVALKGISMAEAAINSYLAFDRVLASPALAALYPANLVAAGITLAAGLAKQVAIATTPIPSAQTGIDNYMVPDIPATRNDRAAVMASAGETVTVTPRGEESEKTMVVNIDVAGDTIFKVVQRGIDTGKINLNSKNIGRTRGVFAT